MAKYSHKLHYDCFIAKIRKLPKMIVHVTEDAKTYAKGRKNANRTVLLHFFILYVVVI